MPQLEATERATGRPPCYSPDRPIPPRDRRRIHPVRLHRRLDRNLLIWIPLSKKSRASLKAESIIRPVIALLQGSKSLRLTESGKTYGTDGTQIVATVAVSTAGPARSCQSDRPSIRRSRR